jgi:hypothetical protein
MFIYITQRINTVIMYVLPGIEIPMLVRFGLKTTVRIAAAAIYRNKTP